MQFVIIPDGYIVRARLVIVSKGFGDVVFPESILELKWCLQWCLQIYGTAFFKKKRGRSFVKRSKYTRNFGCTGCVDFAGIHKTKLREA